MCSSDLAVVNEIIVDKSIRLLMEAEEAERNPKPEVEAEVTTNDNTVTTEVNGWTTF